MMFKPQDKEKRKWFISILRKDVRLLVGTIILGLFASFLGLSISVLSQTLIDVIIPGGDMGMLLISFLIATGILLFKTSITTTQQYLGAKHNKRFNLTLIDEYFKRLLYLPKSFFDNHDTGALIARMNDSASIQQTITYIANTLILNVLVLIVSSTVMFYYSVTIGLIALTAFPIFLSLAIIYKKKIAKNIKIVMDANAKKESNYISTIQNTDLLKTHNKEEMFSKINHDTYGIFQKSIFKASMTGLSLGVLCEIVGTFIYMLMLGYASYQMIIGKITIGEFTASLGIATTMFGPIGTLGFAVLQLQGARIAFDRMYEFISEKPEYNKEEDEKKKCLKQINSIEFKNVYFAYREDIPLLQNLNFYAKRGEIFCIFGANGSGKSTILKLIMRLYSQSEGEIEFNGISIKDLSIRAFREKIAIVSQQSKLFDRSVIENICFETDDAKIQEAIYFLSQLGFDNYIGKLSDGYNTMISENGENLSGGQKQMISLARALCKKPDVLLLDEPTSSLDGESEAFVIDTLKNFKKHGMVIMVTHKKNPAKESDKIVILKKGFFQDMGTHEELITGDNLYSKAFAQVEYD
jgi:ABC-type bacteriocin/lantibiotic exporter with double-glycine peptidase domain